jgi:hypothetical protein
MTQVDPHHSAEGRAEEARFLLLAVLGTVIHAAVLFWALRGAEGYRLGTILLWGAGLILVALAAGRLLHRRFGQGRRP